MSSSKLFGVVFFLCVFRTVEGLVVGSWMRKMSSLWPVAELALQL